MLCTVQILEYYIMTEVIEKNFDEFLNKLNSSLISTDHILEYHQKFLSNCLLEAMVIDNHIQRTMMKLLRISKIFCKFITEVQEKPVDEYDQCTFNYFPADEADCSLEDTVQKFETEYSTLIIHLFKLLRKTNSEKLIGLITRLVYFLLFTLETLR